MTDFVGRVDSVFTRQFSASLASSAAAGATALTVVDGDDLDPAGQLQTPWDGAIYDYTFDGDVTVALASPLASAAEAGEILTVWDPATAAPVVDTVAHVAVLGVDNADDVVEARVSFPLIPLLPEGIRDEENAEAVTVRVDGSDYVVAEVLGQAALIDGAMIDPATVPPAATDGLPPSFNPDVTLRPGIGSLFVVWEPVDNDDPVTYDIYAVPAADVARLAYPPLATDWIGESTGTGAGFRALPDGTELTPTGSYSVAVYARDKDGQCTTSATPVTGSPAQVTSEDLALNALTTDHLTANSALFIALQAEDIVGVNITGSTITGTEFRTGDTGAYWRLGAGAFGSIAIEGVYDGGSSMTDLGGFVNRSLTGTFPGGEAYQDSGVIVRSGRFNNGAGGSIDGHVEAIASTTRQQVTPGGAWGAPVSRLKLGVQGIDSTLDGYATKIKLATWTNPGDTLDLWGGDTTLYAARTLLIDGDQSVTIDSPSITIGGRDMNQIGQVSRTRSVAAQSIPHNTETNLTFDTTDGAPYFPRGTWFSYASGVFTCLVAGVYSVNAGIYFTSGAAGTRRILAIDKNNARMMRNDASAKATANAAAGVSVSSSLPMAAGDTLEIIAYQDSGAALSTAAGFSGSCAVLEITRTA